jgi:hypothetical protein
MRSLAVTGTELTGRRLLLIHQMPPKPDYLRVKVGRRLARIGAVALKKTVYALARSDAAQEDFEWVLREVVSAGGEAALLEARFVDGLSDADVENLFRTARDADFASLAREARALAARLDARSLDDVDVPRQVKGELVRLQRRLDEVSTIDFFAAPGREGAQGLIAGLRARLISPAPERPDSPDGSPAVVKARTWVTRRGVHVDRIASAWLIRRFIARDATFKFVSAKGCVPEPSELRFDMFAAEHTHDGDQCTFEVLRARFGLEVPGLRAIAELIHDLALKDEKFRRPETPGLGAQLTGSTLVHEDDGARLEQGCAVFDQLLQYFAKRK